MKNINELVNDHAKGNKAAFSRLSGIPLRSIEDWCASRRNPPDYLLELLEFSLDRGYKSLKFEQKV